MELRRVECVIEDDASSPGLPCRGVVGVICALSAATGGGSSSSGSGTVVATAAGGVSTGLVVVGAVVGAWTGAASGAGTSVSSFVDFAVTTAAAVAAVAAAAAVANVAVGNVGVSISLAFAFDAVSVGELGSAAKLGAPPAEAPVEVLCALGLGEGRWKTRAVTGARPSDSASLTSGVGSSGRSFSVKFPPNAGYRDPVEDTEACIDDEAESGVNRAGMGGGESKRGMSCRAGKPNVCRFVGGAFDTEDRSGVRVDVLSGVRADALSGVRLDERSSLLRDGSCRDARGVAWDGDEKLLEVVITGVLTVSTLSSAGDMAALVLVLRSGAVDGREGKGDVGGGVGAGICLARAVWVGSMIRRGGEATVVDAASPLGGWGAVEIDTGAGGDAAATPGVSAAGRAGVGAVVGVDAAAGADAAGAEGAGIGTGVDVGTDARAFTGGVAEATGAGVGFGSGAGAGIGAGAGGSGTASTASASSPVAVDHASASCVRPSRSATNASVSSPGRVRVTRAR
jgi:hypothetical protein